MPLNERDFGLIKEKVSIKCCANSRETVDQIELLMYVRRADGYLMQACLPCRFNPTFQNTLADSLR
jgi:hypothetical protein